MENPSKLANLSWIGHTLFVLFALSLIIYFNFQIIAPWFVGEHAQNIASIEISYIQMAKFWVEGGTLWNPSWYLGYPWHVFYTPLLPAGEVLLHWIFDLSFANAYRVLTGFGYVLAPASLFLFVWQISKSKAGALLAALIYSFAPSTISLLFGEVGADTISGLAESRRFTILVRWGEGPHILALIFLPLFGLFLSRYLEKKKFSDQILAAVFLGLVALTNAIALWAAVLLTLAMFGSELIKLASLGDTIRRFFQVGIFTFGLVAFWYNLPFISTFFREGSGALGNWQALFPWGLIPLIAVFIGIFLVVKKIFAKFEALPFSIFWFLMLFALVYVYYVSGENRLEYVPQVLRLNTEVDMAFSVLVGVVASNLLIKLVSLFSSNLKIAAQALGYGVVIAASLVLLKIGFSQTQYLPEHTIALSIVKPGGLEQTAEYRVANKVGKLVGDSNERAMVPANYGFWLNYFVDTPQLRGALYQSSTHFWPDHIYYQLTNGNDAQISLAWLKIANIGKLIFTGPGSAETYKDYKVPISKFESVLRPIETDGGDIYFNVPIKNDSLAKVVDANTFKNIKKPFNAIDSESIFAYVNWMEQRAEKKLNVQKLSNSQLKISGEVGQGEGVLLQQTYDSGWHIKGAKGIRDWKIDKDSFDFMVLTPRKTGRFEIDLVYSKPVTVYLGYLITLVTILMIIRKLTGFNFKSLYRYSSK